MNQTTANAFSHTGNARAEKYESSQQERQICASSGIETVIQTYSEVGMLVIFAVIKYATPVALLLMSIYFFYNNRGILSILIVIGMISAVAGDVLVFAAPLQGSGIDGGYAEFGAFSRYLLISKALYSFGTVISLFGLLLLIRKLKI